MKVVIIGGGPAGRAAAMELAALGEEVNLIEKGLIGGTCLNEGCMVVCGLNDVARFLNDAKNFQAHKIIDVNYDFSYENVANGVKETLNKIRHVTTKETLEAGINLVSSEAIIQGHYVLADGKEYEYDKLIIATGARPFIPQVEGSEHAITYKDILNLKELPEKLNIVGSGMIAAEFAHIFSSMGSEVHILCRSDFLRMFQEDIKEYLVKHLLKGVNIHKNVNTEEISADGVSTNEGNFEGLVLFATGNVPNSEIAGDMVEKGPHGEILVNEKMETSQENIYAAGDVIGGMGTTPVARMEGVVAARNAAGILTAANYRYIPQAMSLTYDVSFLEDGQLPKKSVQKEKANGEKTDKKETLENPENVVEGRIPGSAGPGSFWRVLSSETGFTKTSVDLETGSIKKLVSVAPASRNHMAYVSLLLRLGSKTYDFDQFVETHPSNDSVYKLMRFFSKY
jgi:dihydrolipoamide dehydrogenase